MGSGGQPSHAGHNDVPVPSVPVCPVDGDSELILILQTEISWDGFYVIVFLSLFLLSVTCLRLDTSNIFVSFCFIFWEIFSILSSILSSSYLISLFLNPENSEGFFLVAVFFVL